MWALGHRQEQARVCCEIDPARLQPLTFVKEKIGVTVHDAVNHCKEMSDMSVQRIADFRQQLLAQKASLLTQIDNLRGNEGRVDASAEHFALEQDSSAQVSTERELELTLDARESAELALVDAALRRIEEGCYGLCLDCGARIPDARLNAAPEASRCITCQEKAENHR